MILSFCVTGAEAPLKLDERFGRCHSFAVVDSDTGEVKEVIENTGKNAANAAGTGAVQILVNAGVEGLVAPHLGPKAEDARLRMGLQVWSQGSCGTLEEALAAWKAGTLEKPDDQPKPQGLYRA